MKLKAELDKIHRVNSNGILCDVASLNKLRDGEVVDLPEDAASELLKMGFVIKATNTKTKTKEAE
jgi:hypothetical protein